MSNKNYNRDDIIGSFIDKESASNSTQNENKNTASTPIESTETSTKNAEKNSKSTSQEKKKSVPKSYYLTDEEISFIRIKAAYAGVSVSELLRNIIDDYMASNPI